MKKLAVIVPCYNEELVIAESYRRTREALQKLPVLTEIIYINDGSRDRTRLMLDEIASSDPQVKVIHFSRNFGHQPAVTAGINNCDADLAVILDADMQDPPELIPSILELQEKEQANVVYCVRKSREGEGLFKKVTAKAFYRMLNYMSDVNFPLDTGDFRLIDRNNHTYQWIKHLFSFLFSYSLYPKYSGFLKKRQLNFAFFLFSFTNVSAY